MSFLLRENEFLINGKFRIYSARKIKSVFSSPTLAIRICFDLPDLVTKWQIFFFFLFSSIYSNLTKLYYFVFNILVALSLSAL